MVQTGANIQSGGLNDGLINNEYHGSLKLIVAKPPMKEAENVNHTTASNEDFEYWSLGASFAF